MRRNIRQK